MNEEAIKSSSDIYDFDDFFENALCGFLITDAKGIIIRANATVAGWTGLATNEITGKRFSDLLSTGGKIYYETHLWPLLRMQGSFDEVVLELSSTGGKKMRVMLNGFEKRDANANPLFIRYTILKASDRLQYEQNLQQAKIAAEKELRAQQETVVLREYLIAILGHDLRNPLSAMSMATAMLEIIPPDSEETTEMIQVLKRSNARMKELINNVLDFTRAHLGEGIILNCRSSILPPVLKHVVDELRLIYPAREIIAKFNIEEPVDCDSDRIAQLTSNLVANALTHGAADKPVTINATHSNGCLKISISNSGEPIPDVLRKHLFAPFARDADRKRRQGLGLGLYICSEIAKAHHASLTFTSTAEETCFTFLMKPQSIPET